MGGAVENRSASSVVSLLAAAVLYTKLYTVSVHHTEVEVHVEWSLCSVHHSAANHTILLRNVQVVEEVSLLAASLSNAV